MVAREGVEEQGMEDKPKALPVLIALALAACGPPAAKSQGAPPAAPQGPVNPDAGVTNYRCADGSSIVAGYPDSQTAVVTYRDHAYTLKLAPSASGARYTGYGLQWRTEGDHASIATLNPGETTATAPGVACAADARPASQAATRTAFRPSSP
jgi:membrane-bound inhibitor of C-type lysozyme